MLYIQFYTRAAIPPHDLIEACGDRSVVILDDRYRLGTQHNLAKLEVVKRDYDAYQIRRVTDNDSAFTVEFKAVTKVILSTHKEKESIK